MINLEKGQRIEIERSLNRVRVILGWQACETPGVDFDLDASVYQEDLLYLLSELEASPETFVFLGCYLEAI